MPRYPYVKKNNVQILDAKGIAGMRKVCRLSREVLDVAAAAVKPGVTTDYIDKIVHEACIERKVGLTETIFSNTSISNVNFRHIPLP